MSLKREWFEKIRTGEKTVEYREVKRYWSTRLFYDKGVRSDVTSILFRNGYSRSAPTILVDVVRIDLLPAGSSNDLGTSLPVYAIHMATVRDLDERAADRTY